MKRSLDIVLLCLFMMGFSFQTLGIRWCGPHSWKLWKLTCCPEKASCMMPSLKCMPNNATPCGWGTYCPAGQVCCGGKCAPPDATCCLNNKGVEGYCEKGQSCFWVNAPIGNVCGNADGPPPDTTHFSNPESGSIPHSSCSLKLTNRKK